MLVWIHVIATLLVRYVPVGIAHRVVAGATPLALFFARGFFLRASENMRQVLGPDAPHSAVRKLTVAAFANYARYMVDLLRLPATGASNVLKHVEVRGWENVDRAYQHDKGVVFVTAHIGNWDLAGATFVAKSNRPISVLVETLNPPAWNARVQRIREHIGMRTIPIENGVREMLSTLRRREGLAVVVDRPVPGDNGVSVTFFGRQTRVPAGAATLALRVGSPVVPAVLVRNPEGKGYLVKIGEPLVEPTNGDGELDVQALTQRIFSWLEEIIREYPDQWYMFRRMWPAGA